MTGLLMAGSGIRIFRRELDLFILIDGMRDCSVGFSQDTIQGIETLIKF